MEDKLTKLAKLKDVASAANLAKETITDSLDLACSNEKEYVLVGYPSDSELSEGAKQYNMHKLFKENGLKKEKVIFFDSIRSTGKGSANGTYFNIPTKIKNKYGNLEVVNKEYLYSYEDRNDQDVSYLQGYPTAENEIKHKISAILFLNKAMFENSLTKAFTLINFMEHVHFNTTTHKMALILSDEVYKSVVHHDADISPKHRSLRAKLDDITNKFDTVGLDDHITLLENLSNFDVHLD